MLAETTSPKSSTLARVAPAAATPSAEVFSAIARELF